mmetsp:Transcript_56231/g.168358  ORF Transcript_56231/g.168358 Transcript_56231/m.168358 type:complete len:207 (-) Transcript_56231:1786-2406(-)
MALNVVEGMLCDVGDTGVGVLPDISSLGLDLANKEFDHSRLSGTILTNAGNAGTEGDLNGNIVKGGCLVAGVCEGTLGHLHECFTLGLDALDRSRLGELEFELRLGEGEVRTSRRLELNELVKVAFEGVELQVLDLEHVSAAVVEKARVMTDNDRGYFSKGVEVVLHPSNVDDIEMVGRFVKQKDVCLLKHSTGQGQLHAPSTRKS